MTAADRIRAAPAAACRPWPRHVLPPDAWAAMAAELAADPLALVALWADTAQIHALFTAADGEPLLASTPVEDGRYPALSPVRPVAAAFERMVHDLWGHAAAGADDGRPLLDHGLWPQARPMAPRHGPQAVTEPPSFLLPAESAGLHQLALGPVHAAIAEPVHLRLHAAGEVVAAAETRRGYAHKGVLLLMRGKSPRAAARFAARLSGDSTVAHALAFARAAEAAMAVDVPSRAQILRGVMAELERLANHLGTLAGLGGGYNGGRLGYHREQLCRAAHIAFGHRLMMDCIVPGGLAADMAATGPAALAAALDALAAEWPSLPDPPPPALSASAAIAWAAGGPVARALGLPGDARHQPGYPPYAGQPTGAGRHAEAAASLAMLRGWLASLPGGPVNTVLPTTAGEGLAVAEGPRGPVWHWMRLDGGLIAAAFAADPSWRHWAWFEQEAAGRDVADIPPLLRWFGNGVSGADL